MQLFQTDTNSKINWNDSFGFGRDNPTANFQNFLNDGYSRTHDLQHGLEKKRTPVSPVSVRVYDDGHVDLIQYTRTHSA